MALTQPTGEFNDPDVLRTCLQLLADEATKEEQRTAMETMVKLCKNIRDHSGEEKYRKIRKGNKAIHDKVLRFDGAKEFLLGMGWTEVEEFLMFLDDYDVLVAISILEEYISALPPPVSSPVVSPSVPVTSSSDGPVWTDEELKKKEKKLEEEKRKRMEDYKRLKREREEIKKQIKDDRKDSNTREVKDSHARHLNSGVFKKFQNQGGG